MNRVCVTPSCCWRRLQVWFRWSTVTSCCWCPHSNDHCFTALRKRRSSSWVPNLARGKRLPIMSSTTALTLHLHQCSSQRRLNEIFWAKCLFLRKHLVVSTSLICYRWLCHCILLTVEFYVEFHWPLWLCEAVAGLEPVSCQVSVNRATSRCLLPGLVFGCGGLTSRDRWKTPICWSHSSKCR